MLWILLLGIATGSRTMTPIAVLCWFAYLGRMPAQGWTFWLAHIASVVVFSLATLGEYVGDTLPKTPSRTMPGAMVARLVFGVFVALVADHALNVGMNNTGAVPEMISAAVVGAVGALIGTWGGWWLRMRCARALGRDLPVALTESALALGLAVFAATQLFPAVTDVIVTPASLR